MATRAKGTIFLGVFSVLLTLAAGVVPVSATSYDLNLNNLGVVGSVGTVTTSLLGSSIHVAVQMASGFHMFGSQETFGFNLVDPDAGAAISNLSLPLVFAVNCTNCNPKVQYAGFGRFENNITDGVGASSGVIGQSSLAFDVSRTGGFSLDTQLAELSTSAGGGFTPAFFGVKFGICQDLVCSGFTTTGFGASNTTVPEPGSLILFGTGLVGVGTLLGTRLLNRGRKELV